MTKSTRAEAVIEGRRILRVPSLFRRRHVLLPTVWGALLLIALVVALATLALRHLGAWLAPNEPATARDGGTARTLVVEGWLDEDVARRRRRPRRARDATSASSSRAGRIETWRDERRFPTYAERAADYLRRHGVAGIPVVAVPAPASAQDRTFLSAVRRPRLAAPAARSRPMPSISSPAGVHARRSRLVYRIAFGPEVDVGVIAAAPHGYRLERWWSTSEGAKTAVGELLSLAWTKCCFWPGPPGSHEERWAVPKSPA